MTLDELVTATDDERLHWLGAALAEAKAEAAFGVIAEALARTVRASRAFPKALSDLQALDADARVPAAVKAALRAIHTDLDGARALRG